MSIRSTLVSMKKSAIAATMNPIAVRRTMKPTKYWPPDVAFWKTTMEMIIPLKY